MLRFFLLFILSITLSLTASAQSAFQTSVLFANGKTIFAGGAGGGAIVYRSDNNGITWQNCRTGFNSAVYTAYGFAVIDNLVFVATDEGLYRSEDNGITWQESGIGLPKGIITALRAKGTLLVVGTPVGIYRSEDKGKTWQASNTGLPLTPFVNEQGLVEFGESLCAALVGAGVYVSDDAGKTWTPMNDGLEYINPLSGKLEQLRSITFLCGAAGSTIYVVPCCYANRYRWNKTTKRWQIFEREYGGPVSVRLTSIGNRIIMGTQHNLHNIYLSDDDGLTFYPATIKAEETLWSIFAVTANESTVFAASAGAGIFRSSDKGLTWNKVFPQSTTGIQDTPDEHFLLRVQPNPLHENGALTYQLPQAAHVRISLVNALGQVVKILHDATQSEGEHSISIESNRYGSGVYFVQLEVGASMVRCKIVIAQ